MSIIAGECCRGCGTFIPAGDDCLLCTRASCVRSEIAKPLDDAQVDAMLSGYNPAAHPLPTPRTDYCPTQVEELISLAEALEIELQEETRRAIGAEGKRDEHYAEIQRAQKIINKMRAKSEDMERENAELRAQLAEVKEALAGDDYASLPSDYPLVRMAHTIRADHDKFRNQVIDTCKRAETAERQRDEARKEHQELIMAVAQKWPNETRHQTALRYINERESGAGQHLACAAIDAAKEVKPRQQVDSEHRICEHGRNAFADDCGMCDRAGTNYAAEVKP